MAKESLERSSLKHNREDTRKTRPQNRVHGEKACVHTRRELDEMGEEIEVYDISC
ncbi:hypothetical protein [Aeropyrum camini]|uniref:hypothetical protein n=1 Tax=Aeropyrum camini TaxID=229980 RepID=UPI0012E1D740|nr:hypothetical protein [Aeropyrum camini]